MVRCQRKTNQADREEFEKYKKEQIEHHLETVNFLSSQKKSERERCVCAAFLRCLGIEFSVEELVTVAKSQEPPDVIFRDARFEICEVLDKGRRRHHEMKARVMRLQQAMTVEDIFVVVKSSVPLSYAEVFNHVIDALTKKATQYGQRVCANLDALVCVSLRQKILNPKPPIPDCTSLLSQGWRSVAFVMPPYSHVVYAADAAPVVLRSFMGQTRMECNDLHTVFKL